VGGALGVASEVGAGEELVGLGALQTAGNLGQGLVEGGSPVLLLAAGEEVKRCGQYIGYARMYMGVGRVCARVPQVYESNSTYMSVQIQSV